MISNLSFKTQITWLSTSLILLTVMFLTVSHGLKFSDYAEVQIEQKIASAQNVLNQTLNLQEQVLSTSANVLATDFGFKRAIATQDKQTINSVLINHGNRINADLMMILDLEGRLITSSSAYDFAPDVITNNIAKLPFNGVHAQILTIKNKVFQVIIVPVKAPRIIAYTVIGFEFNRKSLLQLTDLLSLELTIVKKSNSELSTASLMLLESTIDDTKIRENILLKISNKLPNLLLDRSQYYHKSIKLQSSNDIYAIVSTSLTQVQNDFSQLLLSMFVIAVFVILVSVTFSRLLSQGLTTPLNILMNITENIGKGKLEVPKLSNKLPAEFTELYKGFVTMGAAIGLREQEILYQSERDILTGLFNRYKILSLICTQINNGSSLVLITFNIKDFKTVNDTVGTQNADGILKEIARRTQNFLKSTTINSNQEIASDNDFNSSGFAARLNADEFLVCLPIQKTNAMAKLIEQLRIDIERPFLVADIKLKLSFYYGVANSIEHGHDAEKLLRRSAMAALATHEEQISVKYYQQGDDEAYLYKLALIEELKEALDNHNSPLFMHYQPKLNIQSGKVDKLEALIRWINKKDEFVNPEVFVGLAEQSGLIVTLTRWVILQVVKQISEWNQRGYTFKVSINLSAQDIQHETFVDYLLTAINEHNVTPRHITLELTERDLADNENLVASRLTHLKSLGFEVSVDDYGIGQSSLAKLKNLPVDELKIDKTFILALDQSQQDQDIVASTISLGHKLGLRVVAEGVENEASLELLKEFKCNYAQGYYLSRPVSAENFIKWYQLHYNDKDTTKKSYDNL